MADSWTFNDFPGLVLTYTGPMTAQMQYDDLISRPEHQTIKHIFKVEELEDDPLGCFFIKAEVDGIFAGRICVDKDNKEENQLHFIDVTVEEAFRGRGIAKRLMCAAVVKGRELGFKVAIGSVDASNIASRKVQACSGARFSEPKVSSDDGELFYELTFDLGISR